MKRTILYLGILFSIGNRAAAQFEPGPYASASGLHSITIYEATTPEKSMITLMGKAPLQTKQTTEYYDGHGRLIQKVTKQGSPSGKDLVNQVYRDMLGRNTHVFLPFVSTQTPGGSENTTDGLFKLNPYQQQKAFYQQELTGQGEELTGQGETYYYTQTDFDGSPLNRVVKSYKAGNSWVGANKFIATSYEFNKNDENVHIWNLASSTAIPSTTVSLVYATGKLSKVKTTEEDGRQVITYTDPAGNVILKKVQEKDIANLTNQHAGWACTYYVYDDRNQLRFTITPKATEYLDNNGWNLTNDLVNELCYKNEYDHRGRVIVKKDPGAGETNLVYDKKDRLVYVQEPNLNKFINTSLATGKWLFSLYDEYDRVIATGLVDNNLDRQTLQGLVLNNLAIADNVTVSAFVGNATYQSLTANCPVAGYTSNDNILSNTNVVFNSISHYDTYNYAGVRAFNSTYTHGYTPPAQNTEAIQATTRTIGFVTGEKIRVVDNDNNNANDQFIFSSAYYDHRGLTVQSLTGNIKGGTDYETYQYDFAGLLLSTFVSHTAGPDTYTTITKNDYDKDSRLTAVHKNFNNSFYKQIAQFLYNELGLLKQKRLAPGYTATGKNEIELLDYTYNIHNSLSGINKNYALSTDNSQQWDRYFGMHIGYDNKESLFANAQLTGAITGAIWKSQGDNSMRRYNYTYDNLRRFKSALFMQRKKPSDAYANSDMDFSVNAEYEDLNGNLKSLKQMGVVPGTNGITTMDDLRYYYKTLVSTPTLTGNKLLKVDDNLSTLTTHNGILGDFKDHNNTAGTDDYDYDFNGNLVKDDNRNIAANAIVYNYLNKPAQVTLQNKAIIEYTYDASGTKLTKKVTNLVTSAVTYTHYMGDYVYEEVNSQLALRYILHEEGKLKVITPLNVVQTGKTLILNAGTSAVTLPGGNQGVFEYFIKDHLCNVRMVLTEEVQTETYRAYMETAYAAFEEAVFGKVILNPNNTITIPLDNEVQRARTSNAGVAIPWTGNTTEFVRLSAASGKSMGPNILLKVMAGDMITTRASYFYNANNAGAGASTPLSSAVTSLIAALTGSNATGLGKVLHTDINANLNAGGGEFANFINSTQPGTGPSNAPKAYLNVVFLDEQFKFIPGDGIPGVGSKPQRVSVANTSTNFDLMMQMAPKNGWVFVYLSNESDEAVYFDDFWVTLDHARITEETHFYPHGLKMAGITSVAFNKPDNKYGYQGDFAEEEEETGWNEFDLRTYDPQIGRWCQQDPYSQFASPYLAMSNDPVTYIDEDGGFSIPYLLTTTVIGAVIGYSTADKGKKWKGALIGGSIGLGVGLISNVILNELFDHYSDPGNGYNGWAWRDARFDDKWAKWHGNGIFGRGGFDAMFNDWTKDLFSKSYHYLGVAYREKREWVVWDELILRADDMVIHQLNNQTSGTGTGRRGHYEFHHYYGDIGKKVRFSVRGGSTRDRLTIQKNGKPFYDGPPPRPRTNTKESRTRNLLRDHHWHLQYDVDRSGGTGEKNEVVVRPHVRLQINIRVKNKRVKHK
jgi:RHS repeat-associated protein